MRQLVEANPLKNARFFGKILGNKADYYVVESEYKDGSAPDSEEFPPPRNGGKASDDEASDDERAHPSIKKPVDIPAEAPGEGLNRFTYWVTHART